MRDWLNELLPPGTPDGQARAVTCDEELVTVGAGAGTGKTWVLSARFARLLFSSMAETDNAYHNNNQYDNHKAGSCAQVCLIDAQRQDKRDDGGDISALIALRQKRGQAGEHYRETVCVSHLHICHKTGD